LNVKLSTEEIQALVLLILPRERVDVTQCSSPVRLETLVGGPNAQRLVRIWIEPHATWVYWLSQGYKPVGRRARPGRTMYGVSMDAINLIRTGVAWLLDDELPDWPVLTSEWEWDDPAYGVPVKSPRTAQDAATDDCGDDGITGGPRAGEGL
jgi:hypothetical protein